MAPGVVNSCLSSSIRFHAPVVRAIFWHAFGMWQRSFTSERRALLGVVSIFSGELFRTSVIRSARYFSHCRKIAESRKRTVLAQLRQTTIKCWSHLCCFTHQEDNYLTMYYRSRNCRSVAGMYVVG